MDAKQLRSLKPELTAFLERYMPAFERPETFAHAFSFVQGLLADGERRNVENIAEAMEGGVVRSLQKFITQGAWEARLVLRELRRHVVERFGADEAVINVDETGFPKKGRKSVGVKRQYSGILGRVDNCQIGVFINYVSKGEHAFLDRRLFLPEEWANDFERREEAGVPKAAVFRTKPELALSMVEEAVHEGIPFRWVGGDSLYGDSPTFLQGVRELGKLYVVDISSNAHVWVSRPVIREMGERRRRGGRPVTRRKATTKPITVEEAAASIPQSAWRRVRVAEGSQGARNYEYAELTVWFSEEGAPAEQAERLLVRRSPGQEPEIKYQRTNAPSVIPLAKIAEVAGSRWTIEQDFQAAKGECGLDEYETRGWTGWHHHTALSMLALFFLALQRSRLGEKKSADDRPRSSRAAKALVGSSTLG